MAEPDRLDRIAPFQRRSERYDDWFSRHVHVFLSELRALGELVGRPERAVEIGVGTGRFADALGLGFGVEPARSAASRARGRGLKVAQGVGEALPLADDVADLALVVTTICFFDDVDEALDEIARVLEPGGKLLIGFVDRDTPLGRRYEEQRTSNPFYRPATFYSANEVFDLLDRHGFEVQATRQTLTGPLEDLDGPAAVEPGTGHGGFVAIQAGTVQT